MTVLERRFMVEPALRGLYWALFDLDIPEWTSPKYCHQN